MRTLHLYLTRQVLGALFLTVAVFAFVLLLGNALREILALMINRQATFGGVVKAVALLLPYVLVFALPMGLLTATLLVFGRLSADQELTAARAGGVSLIALITPVLLLSVGLAALSAWVNLSLAPRARVTYKELLFDLGMARPAAFLVENRFITDYPGWTIYIHKRRGDVLEDVILYQDEGGERVRRTHGKRAKISVDESARKLSFQLSEADIFMRAPRGSTSPPVDPLRRDAADLDWMTFSVGEIHVDVPFKEVLPLDRKPGLANMTFVQLLAELREQRSRGVDTTPVQVQLHRQASFSFACIAFTLVGIPLGIRAHRRETSLGIAFALVLVLAYYSFFILGVALETRPALHPHLILWVPNFLFQGIGAWLLWRANRGG